MESAATLLRRARQRARLTQLELAQRAGVTQSVISTYEASRRQPSLETLTRLINATGHDLVMSLRPHPHELAHLSGPLGARLRIRRGAVLGRVTARGVSNLRVFGSVARGQDTLSSDIDLVADIPPQLGLFELAELTAELEELLGSPVDLVPSAGLKPGVRERIESEAIPL